MKIFSDNLMPGLILVLIAAGITIFVDDYMDEQNNQIWLLSHKTIFLLAGITLLIGCLSSLLILLSKNRTRNKTNNINRKVKNKTYDQIDRKQEELLRNLSENEKYYLKQFYDKNDRTLMFEPNATLNELCDKDILQMGPALTDRNTGRSRVSYLTNKWAWYYLKNNQHLLD